MLCRWICLLSFLNFLFVYSLGPIQVEVPTGRKAIYAINCGGDPYESHDGIFYEADKYFSTSALTSTKKSTNMVAGNDTVLYQTMRYGATVTYSFPLEKKGYYTLILKMAEENLHVTTRKVFDVLINGVGVFSNMDIFQMVGGSTALDLSVVFFFSGKKIRLGQDRQVANPSKQLIIELRAKTDQAKISGILLLKGVLDLSTRSDKTSEEEITYEPGFWEQNVAFLALGFLLLIVGTTVWLYFDQIRAKFKPSMKDKYVNAVKQSKISNKQK
jgi:hypothetical protein